MMYHHFYPCYVRKIGRREDKQNTDIFILCNKKNKNLLGTSHAYIHTIYSTEDLFISLVIFQQNDILLKRNLWKETREEIENKFRHFFMVGKEMKKKYEK